MLDNRTLSSTSTSTSTSNALAPRLRRAFSLQGTRWWAEALMAVVAYELYDAVQARTSGDRRQARLHALEIERVEKRLHIWVEPALNRFATVHGWIGLSAGYYYALAHVLVTACALLFLWKRRRSAYAGLRNSLVLMSCVALVVFWRWPVSPPRIAVAGLTDTLTRNDILGAAHVHGGLVNLYAAMPSLHVAWATWCACAIVITSRGSWRHVAWLYPIATTLVVIATANHYVLDVVAGAALAGISVAVAARGSNWAAARMDRPSLFESEDHPERGLQRVGRRGRSAPDPATDAGSSCNEDNECDETVRGR